MTASPPDASSHRAPRVAGFVIFGALGWRSVLTASLVRSLEHDFSQGDAAVSLLYFLGSILFAVAALSGGLIAERIGRRPVLLAGSALSVAGLLLGAVAPAWALYVGGASLAGFGGGLIEAQITGLFLDLFPHARGAALNLVNAAFSIGSLLAPTAIGLAVSAGTSWRLAVAFTAALFLAVLPVIALSRMPAGRRREPHPHETAVSSSIPFLGLAVAIACYTASEVAVSDWLVRYLVAAPLALAGAVLSAFWLGLTVSRLASGWVAERIEYSRFIILCTAGASVALAGAVLSPSPALSAVLFTAAGLFYGPVFPTIMALAGSLYPHRIAALSGALTTAASVGVVVYPPLVGVLPTIGTGLFGAALLGLPVVAGVAVARRAA